MAESKEAPEPSNSNVFVKDDLKVIPENDQAKKFEETCDLRYFSEETSAPPLVVVAKSFETKLDINPNDFMCLICGRKFKSHVAITSHVYDKHKIKAIVQLKCEICAKLLGSKKIYNKHMKEHQIQQIRETGDGYKYFESDQMLSYETKLQSHENRIDGVPNRLACQICSDGFGELEELRYHLEHSHEAPPALILCYICGRFFENISSVDSHLKFHQAELKITLLSCQECGHISTSFGSLWLHSKFAHKITKVPSLSS